jgi:hypothetical protein
LSLSWIFFQEQTSSLDGTLRFSAGWR